MSSNTQDVVRDHVIGALKWAENEIVDDLMEMIGRRDEKISSLEFDLATKVNDYNVWHQAALERGDRIDVLEHLLGDASANLDASEKELKKALAENARLTAELGILQQVVARHEKDVVL